MDDKQWRAMVREHSVLVWRTVRRLVAQEADAADCFQETFVSAWEVAGRQVVMNWPGLLQHLATVRALDQLRRRSRGAKHVEKGRDVEEVASEKRGPVGMAEAGELAGQLGAALGELPGQQGEIYCLRHLNEMSYEQIGEELGMTSSAVGANLHRATQRLRTILSPLMTDENRSGG
jgi:RNA polymerase sigma-70 factor (ECF subfamily)